MRGTLGKTRFGIPDLGLGGTTFGHDVRTLKDTDAQAAYREAWDRGVRYFDTAPFYGAGLGEQRVGKLVGDRERSSYFISTKVGRYQSTGAQFDYSYDKTRASIYESLGRINTDRLDIVFIHDIDSFTHGPIGWKGRFAEAMDGAYCALSELKAEGLVGAIGVGVNSCEVCLECLRTADFDVFMVAGKCTLLDQSAFKYLVPQCSSKHVSIIAAAPFNSGILAKGMRCGARYNEGPATPEIVRRVQKIAAVCDGFGVSLGAAALQFALRHPSVIAVVPGPRTAEQVRSVARWFAETIPTQLWAALHDEKLIENEQLNKGA